MSAGVRPQCRKGEVRLFQISTGVGAGNIGDEIMARALWDRMPEEVALDVELFPAYSLHRDIYPARHSLSLIRENEFQKPQTAGLLACGTPVNESEGLDFPLRFIAQRLDAFHAANLPVDAVGVGVDPLYSSRSRELFAQSFAPIRSWTVRTPDCKASLIDLGVPSSKIIVGADWAWLYERRKDLRGWAGEYWQSIGVDTARPLLVVNAVNLVWKPRTPAKRAVAEALDELQAAHGFQIAFFCAESRDGEMFDFAAASEIASTMKTASCMVANHYWSVDEALALLSYASLTISQRYHVALMSVLAGVAPVMIVRGCKMEGLAKDLGLHPSSTIERVNARELVGEVLHAFENRMTMLHTLDYARRQLSVRAENNLAFIRHYYDLDRSHA
jgi:polysaccharide pyruvyl transferase WcaK-like protein